MREPKNSVLLLKKKDFKPSFRIRTSATKLQQEKNTYCTTALVLVRDYQEIGHPVLQIDFRDIYRSPPHTHAPTRKTWLWAGKSTRLSKTTESNSSHDRT